MPHIGFYRAVLHGVTDEECLTRILGLVSRFLFDLWKKSLNKYYTWFCILQDHQVDIITVDLILYATPPGWKVSASWWRGERIGTISLSKNFSRWWLVPFQPLFACFCEGFERSVHNKRAISSRATAQSGLQGVQRRVWGSRWPK